MALESVNALLIVVSVVSSILGIVGTLRAARHDRILRAWAYAVLATASVGLLAYFVVRGWNTHVRGRVAVEVQRYRTLMAEREKTAADLLADNRRKDARIAQLESQLAAPRAGSTNGGGSAGSPPAGTAGDPACTLNDTWECAEPLAIGGRDTDEFRASDSERYYVVDAAAPRAVAITLDPVPKSNSVILTLHDADRRALVRETFNQRPGTIDTRLRTAGRYYIKLTLFLPVRTPERYTIILSP